MAEFTENYNLIKPGEEDYYDVQDFNENMDTIDGVMAATEAAMETAMNTVNSNVSQVKTDVAGVKTAVTGVSTTANSLNSKIGSASDTGTTTVFGKLNKLASGGSLLKGIKSIQKFTLSLSSSNGDVDYDINQVVPENCIVLMDRLHDPAVLKTSLYYTLEATSIKVTATSSTSGTLKLYFQIIEFG